METPDWIYDPSASRFSKRTTSPILLLKSEVICYLLLAHQPPALIGKMLERWRLFCQPPSQLLLCYGGSRENFDKIEYPSKIFLDDPRLRTVDHQREKQSYTQMFQKAARWLRDHPECASIYVAEYDHWPLVKDIGHRLIKRLNREKADVLGHQLGRRDQTSCPYYLYHLSDARFLPWLKEISRRTEPGVVFNMFGSGSFWTREAFLAVAQAGEPFPIYLETFLPTLAHHLGFRVRDFQEQNRFVYPHGDRHNEIEKAQTQGAWTLHPVKTWPSQDIS
ncbi:hypothetical protein OAG63_00430 [Methylacidiphilales bacterium]|nr:hypothetical protein [Candidatus Methylacidiphilales bacterium]